MRKKFTMLLASLFLVMGTAWAQNVVTSTETEPVYYTIASYDRGGVFTYANVGDAVQHADYNTNGNSSWYFEAVPGNANNGVYIVSKNKSGENKVYLGSDKKASTTAAVWYILPNGVNDYGFCISKNTTTGNSACIDAGNNKTLGNWSPAADDWQGTTWLFLGDVTNNTYNPKTWTKQAGEGVGGRKITSITLNDITHNTGSTDLTYVDHSRNIKFTVLAESEISISIGRLGSWMNAYAYIDKDNNGFAEEDAVTYSNLNGVNSAGSSENGNNTVIMPNFTAPATAGEYRLRVKYDWDHLDPNGAEGKINNCSGQFIDVTLVVESKDKYLFAAPEGCTITYNGNNYVSGDAFVPVGNLSEGDFSVPAREGYISTVEIDNENHIVTISYVLNLQAGDKLILKNKEHNVYMGVMFEGGELDGDPAPTTKKLASTSTYNYKNCWELVTATYNETSCFYLYNPYYDWYASPISARNGAVLMSKTADDAGCYQFETKGDYVAIKCLNRTITDASGNTTKEYLHQVNHTNWQVVDWDAGADASQWSFELVKEDTENTWLTNVSTEGENLKNKLSKCVLGEGIGMYSGMEQDVWNTLTTNAIIPAEGSVVEKIKAGVAALYNLQTKMGPLVLNTPQTGKYYRLQNVASNNYMSGNKENITLLTDGANVVSTIFYLDENKALSAVNGKYLDCSAKGYSDTKQNGEFGPAYNGPTAGVITYKNNGCWVYGAGNNGTGLDKMTGGTPNNAGYNWRFIEVGAEDVAKYEEMQSLSTSLGTFMTTASNEFLIALQTTDNTAAGYLSSCGSADGNVESNMIDGSNSTFYGSPWGAAVADIDYQYWQVDLGDGVSLSEFVFSYVTRANGDDTPYSLNIKGSADGTDFSSLAEITEGLPQTRSASYTSATISNPSNYRYIRFEVTDAKKGNGANPGYAPSGHATQKTFAIAEFSIARAGNSLSAAEQRVATALTSAQAALDGVYSQSATDAASTVQNAFTTLKGAYTDMRMESVEKPEYPFTVTTDVNAPVLYAIRSGRTNEEKEWWYTYTNEGKIALKQYKGEENQLWFFKEVITDDYQYALQLYPAADKTKAMSYENTNGGANKIVAKTPGTAGWTNLWLLATTDGNAPYGLQTYDKKNYLSNNGGYTNNMGMHNATPSGDAGTAMYISSQADAAQPLINTAKEMANGKGTTVGYYTEASVATLESAIASTETNFAQGNYTMTALNTAVEGLQVILPESNRFYQIVSALAFSETKAIYSTGEALAWKSFDGTDKTFYWTIVPDGQGKYTLQNVGNEKYINGLTMSAEEVTNTTLKFLAPGQFNIISNGNTFHANKHNNGGGTNGDIINHPGSTNSASAWKIIEVDHPDLAVAKAGLQNRVTELNAIIANMGSAIGQYKDGNKAELQGHVATAQGVLDRGSKVPDDYTTALTTLNDAIAGFDYSLILPEAGKYYQIHSSWTAFGSEEYDTRAVYSTGSNVSWKVLDKADKSFYWIAEAVAGGFVLKNYNDNKYMVGQSANETHWTVADASTDATLGVKILSNEAGAKGFEYAIVWGTRHMHTGGHGEGANKSGRIVSWETNAANSGSSWYIVEINEPDLMIARAAFEAARIDAIQRLNFWNNNAPGYYSSSLENPIADIQEYINFDYENSTNVEEIQENIDGIKGIIATLTVNIPKAGKFYRFSYDYRDAGVKYVQAIASDVSGKANSMMLNSIERRYINTDVSSIFYYDGGTDTESIEDDKLLSYSTGLYVRETGDTRGLQAVGAQAGKAKFTAGSKAGTLYIYADGSFHAHTTGGDNPTYYVDHCDDGHPDKGDNNEHNFIVNEVSVLPVTITNAQVSIKNEERESETKCISTFYTPVALEVPNGVIACTGKIVDNYLALTAIESGIIPAGTGVILLADEAGTYDFIVSAETGTTIAAEDNIITGTVAKAIITPENATCYILANDLEDGIGLYRAKLDKDESGAAVTENATSFLNNACKAYISVPVAEPQAAKALTMRLGRNTLGGTTEIEMPTANGQQPTAIYDLQGRRVLNPTKGMYIVNGKKVIVK